VWKVVGTILSAAVVFLWLYVAVCTAIGAVKGSVL
jgi:hypothetical protein